jgi:hypothetical protein
MLSLVRVGTFPRTFTDCQTKGMRQMIEPEAHITRRISHVDVDTDWTDAQALKLEILKLRDELIGAIVREGELRAQLEKMINKERLEVQHRAFQNHETILAINQSLEYQLDALIKSRTWRVGRFFMRPAGKAKQVLQSRSKA